MIRTNMNATPHGTDFRLHDDPWGRLVWTAADGREEVDVEVLRAFPMTDPQRWIVIRSAAGKELACVAEPDRLVPETRTRLLAALARREFSPKITRVARISTITCPAQWEVETDHGPVSFTVKQDDDVRRQGQQGLLIVDAHGNRYHIVDTRQLDADSRHWIEQYL
ncbi:MAG: DUF1854 domain-containing protein [Pirellulales bacterium]|nr:DUF1854 domain-containing protein [Pirellulales bacterium]